mmetsp:Transcript_14678/g.16239  ORF Transcript_14678/g.16239 Transcript_14678/m.16239 type:complete len:261 (-) Transcript_14678:1030-1812(-)
MSSKQQPQHEFFVIGAGLPRTGTNSTKKALEILFKSGKCYHCFEADAGGESHKQFWGKAIAGTMSPQEIGTWLLEHGYCTGVDYPISFFYKQLLAAFPEAKIVLTVRDPHRWYQSVKNTILQFFECSKRFPTNIIPDCHPSWDKMWYSDAKNNTSSDCGVFGSVQAGEEQAVAFFHDWAEEVKNSVPPERLLVFEVKEGWEPLCQFLGVPIPDEPFPNVNDTKEINELLTNYKRKSWAIALCIPALVSAAGYGAWKLLSK